jgi:hypothetical protein
LRVNLFYELTGDFLQVSGGHQALPHSRLIGDDGHMVVFFSQKAQPLKGAGQENEFVPAGNIAADDALIDDSVAVKQDESRHSQ